MAKSTVEKWFDAFDRADRAAGMSEWLTRCKLIKRKFLYEGSQTTKNRKYQLLWSNTQQLQSAIYSKPPKGVVKRRYNDQDHIARAASQILERAINFSLDVGNYHTTFKRVRDDLLLYAQGLARVYYEPTYSTKDDSEEDVADDYHGDQGAQGAPGDYSNNGGAGEPSSDEAPDSAVLTRPEEQAGGDSKEELKFENVRIRFVHRQDFKHDPARIWEEVNWVAFRAFMTRKEVAKRFSEEIAGKLSVGNEKDDSGRDDYQPGTQPEESDDDTIAIWEVWDRKESTVCWIAKGHDDVLEEGPPYLELEGFFPCPCPAYGTLTNDSLIPVPDYVFYQDQADEIDQLTARIGALTDALKLVGFYPGGPQGEGSPEIERAFRPGFENKMIAVQSWAAFKESGGGQAPVVFLPVEIVGKIIEGCVKLRQQIVEDVYQIIGLSDIMRGATDPNETAQAQQMKAQFGGVRLRDRQAELARFCTDICKLVGQIISVHCQPSTVMQMTNMQLPTMQMVQQMALSQMMQYRQQIAPLVQQYQQQAMAAGSAPQQQPQQPGQPPGQPQPGQPPGQQPQQQQGGIPSPPQIPPPPQIKQPPTVEQVFGLLKDDVLRLFRIDIEAESTVSADESKEKQDRTQLIESATKFMEAWGPMVEQKPDLAPLAGALLMFGVRAFRVGRELEEVIEETVDKFEAQSQQGAGGKPDPKAQAEMVKLQGMQVKAQAEIQKAMIEAKTAQAEAQAKLMAIQVKAEADKQKTVYDMHKSAAQHQQNVVQMHTQAGLDAQAKVHQGMQAQHQAGLDHHARTHQASIDQQASASQQANKQSSEGGDE